MSHPTSVGDALRRHTIEVTTTVQPADPSRFVSRGQEFFTNWSATIDHLESVGKVVTKREAMFAFDPRFFRFSDEETFFGVDCLGTAHCSDVSERVEKLWRATTHEG